MQTSSWRTWLLHGAFGAALALVAGACGTEAPHDLTDRGDARPAVDVVRDAGADEADAGASDRTYQLRVSGGQGGGRFRAGQTVHVFADVDPSRELLVRWEGDVELLADPEEWHSTLVMPERGVVLTAVVEPRAVEITSEEFLGATAVPKTIRHAIPASPRGLILLHHGTGGSSSMIFKEEARYFTTVALEHGFAVVAPESEETAAKQDFDGNKKLRWNGQSVDSIDFANHEQLVAMLQSRPGTKLAELPLFAVGMSNGGAFSVSLGALAATPAAASYPHLRFAAAVSYCADALSQAAALTSTPTAWLMCGQETNPEVKNAEASANSAVLAARGVATLFDVHPPSPLYATRLARVDGVDAQTSAAIVAELEAAGWLDGASMLTGPTAEIEKALEADPSRYPTLLALSGLARLAVSSQLKVSYAEHSFYSDWAVRTIRFFEQHL